MDAEKLKKILAEVAAGGKSVEEAAGQLTHFSFEDIGYAHVDHHRSLRQGFPEVIFGIGKTAVQICGIMDRLLAENSVVLATRVPPEAARQVLEKFPEAVFHEDAGMIVCRKETTVISGRVLILVLSAGTSDVPVAREAALTAEAMGNRVETLFDVGVAGIHRLFAHRELIAQAAVLVVVAGMEGALPSVVAGMTGRPVIAVPTSIGYGASFGGLTALLGMLNSCSSNVAVVNIDNGFGGGFMAGCINRK